MHSVALRRAAPTPATRLALKVAGPSGDHLQCSASGPPRKLAPLHYAQTVRGSVGLLRSPQTLKPPRFEAATHERQPRCGGSG